MQRALLATLTLIAATTAFAQSLNPLPSILVPEPSTLSLLAAGAVALGLARRRAGKSNNH